MKKVIFFVLAILLMSGIAFAAGIPTVVDPKNAPEIWTMEVYNNSGGDLVSGQVVVWDIDASTTTGMYDRCMWVNTTTTADDVWTAGIVVDPLIGSGNSGTICIKGPVYGFCLDSTSAVTVSTLVGAYSTAGYIGDFTGTGADCASLGVALSSDPNTVANGGYGGTGGNNGVMIPIFVDPVRFSDN